MITAIFVALAAICNAIMDTLVHHFSDSIFKKKNKSLWNGVVSWRNKYINGNWQMGRRKFLIFKTKFWESKGINIHPIFTDKWHQFKFGMIFFMVCAICVFPFDITPDICHECTGFGYAVKYLWPIPVYGTIWNLTFSLFYKKLLRKD